MKDRASLSTSPFLGMKSLLKPRRFDQRTGLIADISWEVKIS